MCATFLRPPEPSLAEAERWAVLREALEVDGRLSTHSSRALFKFAYRAWRAAYLNERPSLYVIGQSRDDDTAVTSVHGAGR